MKRRTRRHFEPLTSEKNEPRTRGLQGSLTMRHRIETQTSRMKLPTFKMTSWQTL